jgi:hypothetical protein
MWDFVTVRLSSASAASFASGQSPPMNAGHKALIAAFAEVEDRMVSGL